MRKDKFIVIIFLVAFLGGLFWSHKTIGEPFPTTGDAVEYHALAVNIAEKFSFDPNESTAVYDPLYPIFLAGIYSLFGINVDAVRIIQLLLFALTVVLLYLIVREAFNRKIAFTAGLFTSFFFPLANNIGHLNRDVLFTFLIILLVYVLYQTQKTLKLKWFVTVAVVFCLALLTKSVIQLFIFFILLNFIFIFKKDILKKRIWIKLGFVILFFAGFLVVWFGITKGESQSLNINSGLVLNRKVDLINIKDPLRHFGGQFFGYYFFEKEGFEIYEPLYEQRTRENRNRMKEEGYSPKEINSALLKENLKALITPRILTVGFLDFFQFNGPMLPNPNTFITGPMAYLFTNNSHPELSHSLKVFILLFLRVIYWIFSGLVIYGIIKACKKTGWEKISWLILIIVYFNLVHTAVFGLYRYAVPIYPFYITFFVYGAFEMLRQIKPKFIRI